MKQPQHPLKNIATSAERFATLKPALQGSKLNVAYRNSELFHQAFSPHKVKAVFSLDTEGRFTSANDLMAAQAQLPLTDILQLHFSDFVHPDYYNKAWRCFEEALKGHIQHFEIKIITGLKAPFNATITFLPIVLKNTVVGIHAEALTVSENLQIPEGTRRSKIQQEFAEKISKLGYWELELATQKICWTKELVEIFELEEQTESVDMNLFYDVVHMEDKNLFMDHFAAVVTNEEPHEINVRIVCKDGRIKTIRSKVAHVYENGVLVKLEGITQDITESKERECQLHKSNRQINAILESITDGFIAVDKSFNVTYWNHAAEEITRIKRETILGKNIWDFYPRKQALKYFNEFSKVINTGISARLEDYFSPIEMWIDTSIYPYEDGLSVCFKNITEQKRVENFFILEKEVLQLNAQFNLPIENIMEHMLLGIEKIHPGSLCSIMKLEDGVLNNWCAPSLPVAYLSQLKDVPVGPGQGSCGTAAFLHTPVMVADIATDILWADYKHLAVPNGLQSCWSFPLIDAQNNVLGTFGIYYNMIKQPTEKEINTIERCCNLLTTIIENKRAARELFISNERSKILAKATNDTVWDLDVTTNNIYWNENLKSSFGYDAAAIGGQVNWWEENIHDDDRQRILSSVHKHIEERIMNWSGEYRYKCADGTYKHVYDRGFLLLDEVSGKPIRMIGAMQDITEQKQHSIELGKLNDALQLRAKELYDTNAELERFAYVASHDLQEPLRMVTSFLQLLQKKYYDQIDSTANNYIHYAVDGAERMKRLIVDMLEYSRVNTNKALPETVSMDDVFKDVTLHFANKISTSNATLKVVDPLPVVTAVKGQMLQLVQNLMCNALKYRSNDRQPEIIFSGKEMDTYWQFAIKDNGIGIEERYAEKIFVIFQRLHNKAEYTGTGIGLAICKKIIDKHNGKIWVESVPGEGSTFYFTLAKNSTATVVKA